MEKFSMLEALNTAVETEKLGIEFYGKLFDTVKDKELKELFKTLREEEAEHLVKYINLKKEYEKRGRIVDLGEEAQLFLKALSESEIFKEADMILKKFKEGMGIKEAVSYALEFEKQTLLFFYYLWDVIEPKHRDILTEILKEERNHIINLNELLGTL